MESEVNPYEPPKVDLDVVAETSDGEAPLAGRGSRLGAAMLDGLLILVILGPIQYMLGFYDGFPENYDPSFLETALGTLAGVAVYAVVNGKYLAANGQTIGKKALGIRIVNVDGSKPSLTDIVVKRYLPFSVISLVPFAGPLLGMVNILLIFGSAQRCGHDHVAGTKVVDA
ncbi:MAG: RDD family protein [Nannocystaceae bacterium]|nr:RDD family protein [Nannocystaceae bacterium]